MPTIKLTKGAIDALEPSDKRQYFYDEKLPKFGVKLLPSGKRVFICRYRVGGGRNARARWVTLGAYGVLTLDEARKRARKILGDVAGGDDPAAKAKTERMTVRQLAGKFLEHVEDHRAPRTHYDYCKKMALYIDPAIGSYLVNSVTFDDMERLHKSLRKTPRTANYVIDICSSMFRFALNPKRPIRQTELGNPCEGIAKTKIKERERFMSPEELTALASAITELESEGDISPWAAGCFRLLILTGARRSEIMNMRWDQIDWQRGVARLPETKTGPRNLYLSPPALKVLQAIPRVEGNEFVCVGKRTGKHMNNVHKPWTRVLARAGIVNLRVHDLRHSFASSGVGRNMSLPIIGALLGHSKAETTKRYAHLAVDPLRQANDRLGEHIAAIMQDGPSAEVVPLRKSRR